MMIKHIAIISGKKKHYIGWTGIEGKEPCIVGMEGDKNDRSKGIYAHFKSLYIHIKQSKYEFWRIQ